MAAPKGNQFALGNGGGRPPVFASEADLMQKVTEYFEHCTTKEIKATVTGLTLFLGFESRSTLDKYAEKSEEFGYIIKRAKLAVENSYELSGGTFDIFALKNMGWKDKTERELSGSVEVKKPSWFDDGSTEQTT